MADPAWANVVGGIAAILTLSQVARQWRDLRLLGEPTGVSGLTWLLAYVQSLGLGWLAIAGNHLSAIIVNVTVGAVAALIIGQVWERVRAVGWLTSASLALGAVGWAISPAAVGSIGAAASAFVWIPQAVRSSRSRERRGISRSMVLLGLASSLCWLAYAVLVDEWRFAVSPIFAILSLIVTWYSLWSSPRRESRARSSTV